MRQQFLLTLFSEAKALFHNKQPQQALAQFKTLKMLLEEQRGKSALSAKVNAYIHRITDPLSYAKRHTLKVISKQRAHQEQTISQKQLAAQQSFEQSDFAQAIVEYAELVNLLSDFKHAKPIDLADAYWNLAMANISHASFIADNNMQKALILKEQAMLQVKQALYHYTQSAKSDIKTCQQKLLELKDFLSIIQQDKNDLVVEGCDDALQSKKQAPLPYHKMLLKRFLEARAEAVKEIAAVPNAPETIAIVAKLK